jgi:hypothetical protein
MTNTEPIGQHKVPKCYLKNFNVKAIQKKHKTEFFVDVFDKKENSKGCYTTNIKNICVENDFYTFSKLPDEDKRFIEKLFSKTIESEYASIYPLLIDKNESKISNSQRIAVIHFVISQFFRTSKSVNIFNSFWSNLLTQGYNMVDPQKAIRQIQIGDSVIDFTNKTLDEVLKEYNSSNRGYINLTNFLQGIDILKKRVSDIILINKVHSNHYLITSDNPAYFFGSPFDRNTEIRMPMNHEYSLSILPKTVFEEIDNKNIFRPPLINEEYSYIDTTYNNLFQIDNAERFIIGKKENLLDVIERQKSFDLNLFIERIVKFHQAILSASKKMGYNLGIDPNPFPNDSSKNT